MSDSGRSSLTREERKELRRLGWRVRRHKSKRPRRIKRRNILQVDLEDDDSGSLVDIEREA